MQQLAHTPLLTALGYALLYNIGQFALLWFVYFLVNLIFKLSPHQKYVSAVVAQFAGSVWFIATLIFLISKGNDNYAFLTPSASSTLLLPTIEMNTVWLQNLMKFVPYLSVLYLFVLVFFMVKWVDAFSYSNRIKTIGLEKIPLEWRLFVSEMSMQLGIKKKVLIYLSALVNTPLTIGYFKPIILVPLGCINNLTTSQMEAVLLHELAHIKRFDFLINFLLSLIETVLYFNPFVQLLSRDIKQERENCCDDWVLQFQYDGAMYANALMALVTTTTSPKLALYASDKMMLLARIKRILQPNKTKQLKPGISFAAVIMSVLIGLQMIINPVGNSTFTSNKSLFAIAKSENEQVAFTNKIEGINYSRNNKETGTKKVVKQQDNKSKKRNNSLKLQKDQLTRNIEESQYGTDNANESDALIAPVKSPFKEVNQNKLLTKIPLLLEQALENKQLTKAELIYLNAELQKLVALKEKNPQNSNEDGDETINFPAIYDLSKKDSKAQIIQNIYKLLASVNNRSANDNSLKEHTEKVIIIELPCNGNDTTKQQIIITEKMLKVTKI